jgi:hypothetical protein
MRGDANKATAGMVAICRPNNTAVVLHQRKTPPDGWWTPPHGGLADKVLDGDNWLLFTPDRIGRLWAVTDTEADQ